LFHLWSARRNIRYLQARLIEQLAVAVLPFASFTCPVKVKSPMPVGVPVTAPVDVLRLRPAGSDPLAIEKV